MSFFERPLHELYTLVSAEGPCERRSSNANVETVKRTIVGLKSSRYDDYLCKGL